MKCRQQFLELGFEELSPLLGEVCVGRKKKLKVARPVPAYRFSIGTQCCGYAGPM